MEVVGAEGTVALGALPLSGVVTHLETLVAEHVEALGEHRLLVSGVAAGAAQLGLQTQTCTSQAMTGQFFSFPRLSNLQSNGYQLGPFWTGSWKVNLTYCLRVRRAAKMLYSP